MTTKASSAKAFGAGVSVGMKVGISVGGGSDEVDVVQLELPCTLVWRSPPRTEKAAPGFQAPAPPMAAARQGRAATDQEQGMPEKQA